MLEHIHIRDFAIIDETDLELGVGTTVLTGETGAGKSILVDALGLVLGDRSDSTAVRHGCKRAEISASFSISAMPGVCNWLTEHDLDSDGDCVLRRVINADGGSRAYINGQQVPLQSMRSLGQQLVDIHGQQTHQSLVRATVQRDLLDIHGGHSDLCKNVAHAFLEWQQTRDQWREISSARNDRMAKRDLLRYQVSELEALDLSVGELDSLDQEHRTLANSDRLAQGIQEALLILFDDESNAVQPRLAGVSINLADLSTIDARLEETAKLITETEIQVSEAADNLQRYLSSMDTDPARLEWVELRLAAVQDLARKHRVEARELSTHFQKLRSELDQLEHIDEQIDELQAKLERTQIQYVMRAKKLGDKRKKTAKALAADVSTVMQQLGMPGGRFEIGVEHDTDAEYSANGLDRIEFLVSANPGQPPKSMRKVASGGELSRISLAIQVVAADATRIASLVFDEIDAGIGGGVAEIIGRRLRHLGASHQVLCVTHLPQVASQAHHHFRVSKLTDGKTTRTKLHAVSNQEQVEELARMLGGIEITEKTREHAREMIAEANSA